MDKREERIELFKIMVDSAANNENKRVFTNTFYTALLVGLLSLSGKESINPIVFSLISLIFSIIWFFNIRTYRALAKAKFHVIDTMEKEMLYPIFTEEWSEFEKGKHCELTNIEIAIPCVTGIISIIILGIKLYPLLYNCVLIQKL